MKFNGKKPNAGNTVNVVIPRQGTESMLFVAKGIFDYTDFDKQFPEPSPAETVEAGIKRLNYDHPKYKERFKVWVELRTHWIVLKSLEGTPGLEWETVDMADSKTWKNYETELNEILLPREVTEVSNAVAEACALTSQKVEEATQSFLLGVGPDLLNLSSPVTEPTSTQSLELVKDSDSTPSETGKTSQ